MKIFDVYWDSFTGGPSPTGKRIELFLKGCHKAMSGNPCNGCFNERLWEDTAEWEHFPSEIVNRIFTVAQGRPYVTIIGGEPTDQLDELVELCVALHALDAHVILFTWKDLKKMAEKDKRYLQLAMSCDVIVDGEYDLRERIYDDSGLHPIGSFIGSGNQRVWSWIGGRMVGVEASYITGASFVPGEKDIRWKIKKGSPRFYL